MTVALGLGLTACTADSGPRPTASSHTETASPTEEATPSASSERSADLSTPPARPAAMASPSADGAAAAASYFISLYPYAYATGDLTEWQAIADPSCEFCGMVADEVIALHDRGHSVVGPLTVVSSSGIELEAQRWYSAEVVVDIGESTELDGDGHVVGTDGAGVYRTTYSLTWADGWRVDAVGLEPAATGT